MRDILSNVTFMSLAIGEISPSMLGAGLGAFLPKVVESQFSLSASTAALLVGECVFFSADYSSSSSIFLGMVLAPQFHYNLKLDGVNVS
jgi:hypothetical protein